MNSTEETIDDYMVSPLSKTSREYKLSKSIYDNGIATGVFKPFPEELKNEHKDRRTRALFGGYRKGRAGEQSRSVEKTFGKYVTMTDEQKQAFLDYVKGGVGEPVAADMVGVTVAVLNSTKKADIEFAQKARTAYLVIESMLEAVPQTAGLDGSSGDALAILRFRHDKQNRQRAYRLERHKVEQKRQEIELKAKEVEGKLRAINQLTTQSAGRFDYDSLTDEEFNRFSSLYERMKTKRNPLTDSEKIEWASLNERVLAIEDDPASNKALLQINGVSSDSSFEDEED